MDPQHRPFHRAAGASFDRTNALPDFLAAVDHLVGMVRRPIVAGGLFAAFVLVWAAVFFDILH